MVHLARALSRRNLLNAMAHHSVRTGAECLDDAMVVNIGGALVPAGAVQWDTEVQVWVLTLDPQAWARPAPSLQSTGVPYLPCTGRPGCPHGAYASAAAARAHAAAAAALEGGPPPDPVSGRTPPGPS